MTSPACKACAKTWPHVDHHIVDLGLSTVYLHEDQFFPGWTVIVLKRHATELFHLAPPERAELMEEVSLIANVIAQTFNAAKINYELLGNQLPHIHWHIIPRCANDPAPLDPVWRVPHDAVNLSAEVLRDRIDRIVTALKQMDPQSEKAPT